MRTFYITIAIISLICCCLLYFLFNYSGTVILYHLVVVSVLCCVLFVPFRLLNYIRSSKVRLIVQNLLCLSFFLSLCIFYLVIIGSIAFWGKAIELGLLISYLASIRNLIEILPVQSWILYSFLIAFFLSAGFIYYLIRPRTRNVEFLKMKSDFIKLFIFGVGTFLLYKPIILFKRQMHAADEPVLAFVFPRTWHSPEEKDLYRNILIRHADNDQDCVEKVKKEAIHADKRNVILIVLDALRSDHMTAYGYNRLTTPFLDSMVNSGSILRIKHPFSPSTNTLSGIANIFSSKGIEDFSFNSFRLMEYMQMKKFTTYAFLTGASSKWYWLADIYRNNCDVFYESNMNLSKEDDDLITISKFNSTKFVSPSFVYIHLLSTHILGKKHNQFKKFFPDKMGINGDKKEVMINNYDNGIIQADYLVKEIFEKLERDGQLEKTTVFILADHGELLGEEDRWGHNSSVNPYLQTIPLLVYDQDTGWYKNTYSATLLDIAPTIADRLGYSIPDCWTGKSLHRELKDFKTALSGVMPCDLPFGVLYNKDSMITMDLLDKNRILKRQFSMDRINGAWIQNY